MSDDGAPRSAAAVQEELDQVGALRADLEHARARLLERRDAAAERGSSEELSRLDQELSGLEARIHQAASDAGRLEELLAARPAHLVEG
jgi:predicted  nucleic acid-binding Zn-ribbon protein